MSAEELEKERRALRAQITNALHMRRGYDLLTARKIALTATDADLDEQVIHGAVTATDIADDLVSRLSRRK